MRLRLFAALPLPDDIADRLAPLQQGLTDAAWRPRDAFHITLRFFGEIDHAAARDLDQELAGIVLPPFEVGLDGVGSFGGKAPTAVWASVRRSEPLERLASACNRAARRAGLAEETHPFRPHITLAYLRGATDDGVAAWQGRFGTLRAEPFWCDHFCLYASHQTKCVNAYTEEAVYPLTGAGA